MDHGVFRSWCPHCVKGRAEAYGHRRRGGETGDVPTASLDYTRACSEQDKGEEKLDADHRREGQRDEDGNGEGRAEQGRAGFCGGGGEEVVSSS